ncbi:hypothetical protein CBER1_07397 [Cercospora berteroae]|uniref:Uncharacterized protein n=1 Tax=Cercospora berteroae TaxID=357750 RepID=A0A2S6CMW2_9PEZI|nr:hypothetical protein CBER1_07397 [Cercospora berteroae]
MRPRSKKNKAPPLFTSAAPSKIIKPKFQHKRKPKPKPKGPWKFVASCRTAHARASANPPDSNAQEDDRSSRSQTPSVLDTEDSSSASSGEEDAQKIAQSVAPSHFNPFDNEDTPGLERITYRGVVYSSARHYRFKKAQKLASIHKNTGIFADELIPGRLVPKNKAFHDKREMKWDLRTIIALEKVVFAWKKTDLEQQEMLETLETAVIQRHGMRKGSKQIGKKALYAVRNTLIREHT